MTDECGFEPPASPLRTMDQHSEATVLLPLTSLGNHIQWATWATLFNHVLTCAIKMLGDAVWNEGRESVTSKVFSSYSSRP